MADMLTVDMNKLTLAVAAVIEGPSAGPPEFYKLRTLPKRDYWPDVLAAAAIIGGATDDCFAVEVARRSRRTRSRWRSGPAASRARAGLAHGRTLAPVDGRPRRPTGQSGKAGRGESAHAAAEQEDQQDYRDRDAQEPEQDGVDLAGARGGVGPGALGRVHGELLNGPGWPRAKGAAGPASHREPAITG